MTEKFIFPADITARLPKSIDPDFFKALFRDGAYGAGRVQITGEAPENTLILGEGEPISREGAELAFRITSGGIFLSAVDHRTLIQGFLELLGELEAVGMEPGNERFALPLGTTRKSGAMPFRSVHICIFPQTDLRFLEKCIVTAAFLKMTHIVLEFWGTLRLDCLPELAWPGTYTKEQIRPLIQKANALGLEVIPMFNHLGHATSSRVRYGKHVVLDQSLRYAPLFTPDGWCWRIDKPEVRELMRHIRAELMELCGNGDYFLLGCDEAYSFPLHTQNAALLADYLNEITAELAAVGRRAVIWGDMLLTKAAVEGAPAGKGYTASSADPTATEQLLAALDRRILIADWQYDISETPWRSAVYFASHGFEVLACPWHNAANLRSAIKTAHDRQLLGVLYTTWHTLCLKYDIFLLAGALTFADAATAEHIDRNALRLTVASLLRRLCPSGGIYAQSGWLPGDLDETNI